jgi:two-component system invasion response regulator UvrY
MINVVTIDAHEVFRTGLKALFSSTMDIRVVGEALNEQDGLKVLLSGSVDVLITELSPTGRGSLGLISRAKKNAPALRVLVLTAQGTVEFATRALRAGATGFLTKDATASEIIIAVRKLARGHVSVSDQVAAKLMTQFQDNEAATGYECLTDRELDVFIRIAQGESCADIARTLSLSPKTISTHKTRIMEKLSLLSTSDIVRYALAHGLIPAFVL